MCSFSHEDDEAGPARGDERLKLVSLDALMLSTTCRIFGGAFRRFAAAATSRIIGTDAGSGGEGGGEGGGDE